MLAEEVGMSRQGVHSRLKNLSENNLLDSHKKGGTRLWYLTTDGEEKAKRALR